MLKTLHVRDFGIIEEVLVDLGPGLVALTGETGAGKSLIVDAIALLLGQRADPGVVRQGARRAIVEAVLDVSGVGDVARDLADAGVEPEDGEVRLTRVVQSDGGSRAFVQGRLATVRDLKEVGGRLLAIAGQHAFTRLAQPRERVLMLDAFAGLDSRRVACARRYRAWREARSRLQALRERTAERAARQDYLEFVVRQISAVALREGEVEALQAEREVLRQAERLKTLASSVVQRLYEGEGAACDALGRAAQDLHEMARVDATVADLARRIEAARIEAREVARDVAAHVARWSVDPGRLQAVEDRIEAIRSLERRYGGDTAAVLETLRSAREELAAIAGASDEDDRLAREVEGLEREVLDLASDLHEARLAVAGAMSRAVTETLHDLGMEGAVLDVAVEAGEPGETGADRVDFRVATNPGEGAGPVTERASGGELSRITLALYSVVSSSVGTPVLVADEIDAGVSGAVADRMGEVLARAGRGRQVLVVTHHGQIAARASTHLLVTKRTANGRTTAQVSPLDGDARVSEVARMIGGRTVTPRALAHAREMLAAVGERRTGPPGGPRHRACE